MGIIFLLLAIFIYGWGGIELLIAKETFPAALSIFFCFVFGVLLIMRVIDMIRKKKEGK